MATRTIYIPWLLAAAVIAADGGCNVPASQPAHIRYAKGRRIAILSDKSINESSGMACGRRNKDVFWTHNDSGDEPRIFAFNRKGEKLATYAIEGAAARDWEDMASFQLGKECYLLLGDVGDNAGKKKKVTLYLVKEPKLRADKTPAAGRIPLVMKIDFTYEDGPDDCESVAVDPTTRTIYLLTKRRKRSVYMLPIPDKPTDKTLSARAIAKLDLSWTTAMDMSPDGLRAVVLTYTDAYEYTRRPNEQWAQAFARKGRRISMPRRRQGESICYGPDGKTLYLTSEKVPTPLLMVPPVRTEATSRPTTKEAS